MSTPLQCPACGQRSLTPRSSSGLNLTLREVYYECRACAYRAKGVTELTHIIAPGTLPEGDHLARLPLSPTIERREALQHYRRVVPSDQHELPLD